jgi:EAL domain-containing protein (putative c-di-GMP-specific phosphodiesterase class I)
VQDPRRATVVETLIIMSRQLGFDVIAEGVETREELAFLVDKDCACFQGYYFSKPKPEEEFTQYLRLLAK